MEVLRCDRKWRVCERGMATAGPGSGVVRVSEGCFAEFFDAEADHHDHVVTTCATIS